jgi:hypothetical protein
MYWLASHGDIDKAILLANIKAIIFMDMSMREEKMDDIASRLGMVLRNRGFIESLGKSKRSNWLGANVMLAAEALIEYFRHY